MRTREVTNTIEKPLVNAMSSVLDTSVAFCGFGMRLPGSVRDADSFWRLLCNGSDGRCRVLKDRYNVDAFYGPGEVGHVASEYGYFLDDLNLNTLMPRSGP